MKKILTILLATIIAMCVVGAVYAATSPVPGDPMWKDTYVNDLKNVPAGQPVLSARTDASGDKISSNAHSADYPGLYFYWNDQQKDDGVLLVNGSVFDMFNGAKFTLTAKNSNTYWDWPIAKDSGYQIEPGVYAYKIARNVMTTGNNGKQTTEELKNINMVFIDGSYKDATVTIEKVWKDEAGNVITNQDLIAKLNANLSFTNGFALGNNAIKISAWAGKKVTFAENQINRFKLVDVKVNGVSVSDLNAAVSVGLRANDNVTVVLTNQKQPGKIDGGCDTTPKGKITFEKFVLVNGTEVAWKDWDNKQDASAITFAIYDGDTCVVSGLQMDENGMVTYEGPEIQAGKTYTIKEDLGAVADKYQGGATVEATAAGKTTYTIVSSSKDNGCFEVDPANSWYMPGSSVSIKEQWNQGIINNGGAANLQAMQDLSAQWIWDRSDSWAYGVDGSQIIVYTKSFNIADGSTIPASVPFYFACDNAAVVYVNGQYAGDTEAAMAGRVHDFSGSTFTFGDLSYSDFDGAPWNYAYNIDIAKFLTTGDNQIVIYAANSTRVEGDANNGIYDTTNNPCGLIFACQFTTVAGDNNVVKFVNKVKYQPKGIIQLVKMVQRGDNAPMAWDSSNPDYVADNDHIWFDLYKGDSTDKQASVHADNGVVTFEDLVVGQEYTIKESFDDPALADKYVAINPITTTAWAEDTTEHPTFTQVTPDPSAGVVNQRDVIISNVNDPDLKVYDCFNGYDNKELVSGANLDDENAQWYNSMTNTVEPVVPFWRSYMAGFSDFYANNLANLWLNPATQDYRPEFVWNTADFTDPVKAVNGDTVIFEKEFTPLDQINGPVTLYASGDNAFLVYVNGQYAGKSDAVVCDPQSAGLTALTADNLAAIIGNRDDAYINTHNDMATWEKVYTFDITNLLTPGVANTITIVGINESKTDQGFDVNPMKNPGGFIFGCEVNSQTDKLTFVNQLPGDNKDEGTLAVNADVNLTYDQVTYAPVYETLSIPNDTTVSKSVYSFPNDNSGMRYVAVNVAAASSGDGVWYEMAKSDPSNTGLGLSYNVKIAGGQLTVSFADGVVVPDNNIGILLSATPFSSRPTNELKHDNVLTKALPAGTGDVVYLYFHSQGGIQYNGTKIVDWKEVGRETLAGTYDGTLKLEISGPNDYSYVDEDFNGAVTLDQLEPGDYTVTLSGDGFDPITQDVTVVKDDTTTVPFSVDLKGPDVEIK